jgi:hypothetical protein
VGFGFMEHLDIPHVSYRELDRVQRGTTGYFLMAGWANPAQTGAQSRAPTFIGRIREGQP